MTHIEYCEVQSNEVLHDLANLVELFGILLNHLVVRLGAFPLREGGRGGGGHPWH